MYLDLVDPSALLRLGSLDGGGDDEREEEKGRRDPPANDAVIVVASEERAMLLDAAADAGVLFRVDPYEVALRMAAEDVSTELQRRLLAS